MCVCVSVSVCVCVCVCVVVGVAVSVGVAVGGGGVKPQLFPHCKASNLCVMALLRKSCFIVFISSS